jgi:hypothetical protein
MYASCVALLFASACRIGFDDVPGSGDAPAADGDAGLFDGSIYLDAPPADAPVDAALVCPGNYVSVPGESSRYRAINNSSEWLLAEQACEADGTHLWIPDSANEKSQMVALLPAQNIWTGVTDRKVIGEWLRVTGGVATYLPWNVSEPDATDLECVYLDGLTNLLSDQGCLSGRRYICECDGAAAMPSTY